MKKKELKRMIDDLRRTVSNNEGNIDAITMVVGPEKVRAALDAEPQGIAQSSKDEPQIHPICRGLELPKPDTDAITAEGLESLGFEFDRHDKALGDVYMIDMEKFDLYFFCDDKSLSLNGFIIGKFTTMSQITTLVNLLKETNA